jgi:phospholipase C
MSHRKLLQFAMVAALAATAGIRLAPAVAAPTPTGAIAPASLASPSPQDAAPTATPIKHVVVLFNENVSFDHYFATYPNATNPPGEPAFTAAPDTPTVNNLATAHLLSNNPNATNTANGSDAAEPFRLDRTQASTADQEHTYTAEQQAYDGGRADLFPKYTGKGRPGGVGAFGTKGEVMGYYDGNTVTAMWQYAQHFALNDNTYNSAYGPSTPGALELVAGQTNGIQIVVSNKQPSTLAAVSYYIKDGQGGFTLIGDVDPGYDVCSLPHNQVMLTARNIGDLLNAADVTWGGFMGGFNLDIVNPNGTTGCKRRTFSTVVNSDYVDYVPHHNWFQYFASTANPTHARPSSITAIGYSYERDGQTPEPANHEYDLQDFYAAVKAGNFPAVSFIKPQSYQDGHAGYSDPLDEQMGTVALINFLQQQPDWKNTAVFIAWDDSDGWYDHAFATTTSASYDAEADQLDGPGKCGTGEPFEGMHGKPVNGRCGPGTRVPFLIISPWARPNFVSHTRLFLASVTRFIEDNWLHGSRLGGGSFDATAGSIMDMFDFSSGGGNAALYLDPATGLPMSAPPTSP